MEATYNSHTRPSSKTIRPPLPHSHSTSYLYPTTLPSPSPSILSSPEPTFRTRLRSSHPHPIPTSYSSPSFPIHSRPRPVQRTTSYQQHSSTKPRSSSKDNDTDGHDWLLRTASAVTTSTLEEKGYTWLATRHSSTSLTGPSPLHTMSAELGLAGDEYSPFPKWGNYPRVVSQLSQLNLDPHLTPIIKSSRRRSIGADYVAENRIEPDFVIPEHEADDFWTDELAAMDEGEMKRIVMGRVGGWVDWAVGWMDFRGEGDDEEDDEVDSGSGKDGYKEESERVDEWWPQRTRESVTNNSKVDGGMEKEKIEALGKDTSRPSSKGVRSSWTDAKWLLGVASSIIL